MDALDARQLRYFLAVVEAGSLSRAARELGLSEPALSKSIRLLEHTLQVRLLERHSRGMTPTHCGRALAEHARVIRSELRHALNEVNALRGGEKGQVVVGTFPSFAIGVLPRAIARLLARHPGVRFTVREALAESLVPLVLSGDVDCAIMTMRPYELDPNLVQEPLLRREAGVVVMGPYHRLGQQHAVSLKAVRDETWILPPKPDGLRLEFEQLFECAGLTPPRPSVENNSVLFIRAMLLESDCVSYLPRSLVQREGSERALAHVTIREQGPRGSVGLVYRRHGVVASAAKALMAEVRGICRGLESSLAPDTKQTASRRSPPGTD